MTQLSSIPLSTALLLFPLSYRIDIKVLVLSRHTSCLIVIVSLVLCLSRESWNLWEEKAKTLLLALHLLSMVRLKKAN